MRTLPGTAAILLGALALAATAGARPLDRAAGIHVHGHGVPVPGGWLAFPLEAGGSGSGSPGECSDATYDVDLPSYQVQGTFDYWFISSSTPSGLSVTNTETAVKSSVTNWTKARNSCGMADEIPLKSAYQGRTSGAVEINNDGTCKEKPDSKNETGFGTLPSSLLGVACVWFGWAPKPPYPVIGADVRLNKAKGWWNTVSSCKGSRYIVEAALTHERGHIFGLTHGSKVTESKHAFLTMSPAVNQYCSNAEATLGKGDVLGMRANY